MGQRLKGRIEKYSFEVGILDDKEHKVATKNTLSTYAGGPVRKTGRSSGVMISEISKDIREKFKFNYLTEPFKDNDSEIMRLTQTFFKYIFGRSTEKRLTNLLQAIVRNPILRGDYGSNTEATQKIKGFDRFMIDTGQLFKAITARVVKR